MTVILPSVSRVWCSTYKITHSMDFLLLDVTGCDIILGAKWLESLGFIGWHFKQKSMVFSVEGKTYTLHGLTHLASIFPSCYHMDQLLGNPYTLLASITSPDNYLNPPTKTHFAITSLIHQYKHIFITIFGLPPERTIDHKIPSYPVPTPSTFDHIGIPIVKKLR